MALPVLSSGNSRAVLCSIECVVSLTHRHIVWQSVHHLQLLQGDLVNLVHNIQRGNIHAAAAAAGDQEMTELEPNQGTLGAQGVSAPCMLYRVQKDLLSVLTARVDVPGRAKCDIGLLLTLQVAL